MQSPSPVIAIFGSSSISQESEEAVRAYRLGHDLAKAGFTICNGGYWGVMEACSRGAAAASGKVIGVTCSSFSKRTPNPYLSEEIVTSNILDRITELMRLADAYVIMDGNIGTLAELFLSWNLVALGSPNPLLVVGEEMRKALEVIQPYTEIKEKHLAHLRFVPTVDEAVSFLRRYFDTKQNSR